MGVRKIANAKLQNAAWRLLLFVLFLLDELELIEGLRSILQYRRANILFQDFSEPL